MIPPSNSISAAGDYHPGTSFLPLAPCPLSLAPLYYSTLHAARHSPHAALVGHHRLLQFTKNPESPGKSIPEKSLNSSTACSYGLLGANGCGKSTFLRCVAERLMPIPKHMDIFLLEQEVEPEDKTAMQVMVPITHHADPRISLFDRAFLVCCCRCCLLAFCSPLSPGSSRKKREKPFSRLVWCASSW
jgi:hypothetical protein